MTGQRRADNRPPYMRIAEQLRERIGSGDLRPGDLLPSIKALAGEFGVSTATADRAMRLLRDEGIVKGIPGVGTEVIGRPVGLSSGSERHDRSGLTHSTWGDGEQSSGHRAAIVAAPSDVAAALGIAGGDDVIRRSRVYRDARGIVAYSTSWLPTEFATVVPALLRSERLPNGSSLNEIAKATNRITVRRIDEEQARIATGDDLEALELPPHTVAAILVLTSRFLDADDQVLEYGVDLGAPGRTRTKVSEVVA
ncbi:GntR family transcriptional regulator [Streptomyces sp. NPDC058671]|uniref:GntR family transcriptional regulator n=1 Tax=Streptomyces sp. NPDC058671 TaxID=3346590 RepID=UPI003649EAF3